jgi:hypothetical protein
VVRERGGPPDGGTPEPLQHPLHRGSYSGARDLACTGDMMEAEFGSSTAITNNANNRRGHAPKKIMIEAPVASTHWVDLLTQCKNRNASLGGNEKCRM